MSASAAWAEGRGPLPGHSKYFVGSDAPAGAPHPQHAPAAAFAPNTAGNYGNAGYNSLTQAAYFDMDTSLTRYFPIRERQRFELRFEFFNVLNHTNLNAPVNSLKSQTFGIIQGAQDPRILQFAAKYSF